LSLSDEAKDLLVWAYLGEIGGEAYFKALGDDPTFRALAALERDTARRVRGVLNQLDIKVPRGRIKRAREATPRLIPEGKDWAWFLAHGMDSIDQALAEFARLGDLAPECREIADQLIVHELAIKSVMQTGALDAVTVLLPRGVL
jgi:hypothetical protein